jgi:hypothetical protein
LGANIERPGLTQLGEEPRPGEDNGYRSESAADDLRDRPDDGRDETAFRLSELIGSADEQRRYRTYAAPHFVGRMELD